ncbi:MAG: DNA-directed RNA polymerase subunit H [Candidatus Diapherotrites archaeon]|nr:DNA-directed RNA polymerase subunit H [Candidatus Diapherotrites archaeon]
MGISKIQEHVSVPKHEVVPKTKVEQILQKYGIDSVDKVPGILPEDPVVEELNAVKGDLIRIVRKSPTASEAIYFRVVM